MSVYERLRALNITLPQITPPAAAFVPCVRTGNLLFVSGHIARKDGQPWVGKLGADLTTTQGKEAARGIAIELLATLHAAIGDLNKIARIVKLLVLVNSTPQFTEQHLVANGASELPRSTLWRTRLARPQRLRHRPNPARLLRRNRTHRRSGLIRKCRPSAVHVLRGSGASASGVRLSGHRF